MEQIQKILDYAVGEFTVGKLLAAIITFVIGYLAIRLLSGLFAKFIDRTSIDGTLKKYSKAAIKVVLSFILAMVVVDALGISPTSFIAAFSVVGLAASLAVQDSLSNIASGIMLIINKPFKAGDYIEVDNVSGTVVIISLVHTKIVTIDNKMIFIPNSKLTGSKITNYTAQEKRRVDVEIGISYDVSVEDARAALLKAVDDCGELFIDKPQPPFVAIMRFSDSSIDYVIRVWTWTKNYWDAYFALLESVKKECERSGVEITYNHINVHMIDGKKE